MIDGGNVPRRISNVWWCGIDRRYCSFKELKQRHCIAQGVPTLGSLNSLFKFMDDKAEFKKQIVQLGDLKHSGITDNWWFENRESNIRKIPRSMFNLLRLSAGDLIVALEGTAVRGLCQIEKDALDSYEFQASYDYAHAVGYPVKWLYWNIRVLGHAPTPPAQSVFGVHSLCKDKDYVISCWIQLQLNNLVPGNRP